MGFGARVAAGLCFFAPLAGAAQLRDDVPVPGGMKALAAIAKCSGKAGYGDFVARYCDALVRNMESQPGAVPTHYAVRLREYFTAVSELADIAEQRGARPVASLSLRAGAKQAAHVLALFGWKVIERRGAKRIELGGAPSDAARQEIPAALGIDALLMQQALERGGTFRFELLADRARMAVDSMGSEYSDYAASLPGGLLELFARDLRVAKTYLALSAASRETANALTEGVGLRTLVERHADLLVLYGKSFTVSFDAAAVPGGVPAEPLWAGLAGASPRDPPGFLRALLNKDGGRLAAFYSALAQSDAAHQRLFTASRKRLTRFYRWYRDSAEFSAGAAAPSRTWRPRVFRELPLDVAREWPAGDSLEAAIAIASLERRRGGPLDERSAALIAEHFDAWRPLMPYFEVLSALDRAGFESLAAFEQALRGYGREARNLALGDWYSLVELIALGVRAGSLDARAGADAFRRACEAGRRPHPSAAALEVFRSIGGGTTEGVRTRLLRLSGARGSAFDRILKLQNVPPLEELYASNDDARTLAGLSGLVYAAHLAPDALLVVENPLLLRKHRFFAATPPVGPEPLFQPARLEISSKPPGSRFTGGFAGFEAEAQALLRTPIPAASPSPRTDAAQSEAAASAVFRAQARLVEVPVTVTDARGRHVDGLPAAGFTVLDEGVPQRIAAFEPQLSAISCALVLDGTSSVRSALESMRQTAFRLVDALRPSDSVAVFAFNETLSVLQPFTTDKTAAKRAVLSAQIGGRTALYDALVRASRAISTRSGKKVIVVLTDGSDNDSMLTADTAARRAKNTGAVIYTLAEGSTIGDRQLVEKLAEVASATGGLQFVVSSPSQIPRAVQTIATDFTHGYLFAFRPAPGPADQWRRIQVVLRENKNLKVRARQGYFPD